MAPPPKVNLAFMHFTFKADSELPEDALKVHRRHDKPTLSNFVFARYDWAKTVLNSELIKLSKAPDIRFSEWRFETSKPETLQIDDVRFDKLIVFLGEDLVHWSFYNDAPNGVCIEGQADLPLTYCSCCLQEHYSNIIIAIKDWIREHNIKPKTLTQPSVLGLFRMVANGSIS